MKCGGFETRYERAQIKIYRRRSVQFDAAPSKRPGITTDDSFGEFVTDRGGRLRSTVTGRTGESYRTGVH